MIRISSSNRVRNPSNQVHHVAVPPRAFRKHRRSLCGPSLMALSPLDGFFDLSPSHLLETEDFMGLEKARPIAVDFVEDSSSFQIKADIPGVPKSNIKLDVDHNVITISASRSSSTDGGKDENADANSDVPESSGAGVDTDGSQEEDKMGRVKDGEDHGLNVLRFERFDSFVSRSFRMPRAADLSTISAKYEDGVLTVDVKKTAEALANRRTVDIE